MTEAGYGLCRGTYCPADPLRLDSQFDKLLRCELGIMHKGSHAVKVGPGLSFRWTEFRDDGYLQRVLDE